MLMGGTVRTLSDGKRATTDPSYELRVRPSRSYLWNSREFTFKLKVVDDNVMVEVLNSNSIMADQTLGKLQLLLRDLPQGMVQLIDRRLTETSDNSGGDQSWGSTQLEVCYEPRRGKTGRR